MGVIKIALPKVLGRESYPEQYQGKRGRSPDLDPAITGNICRILLLLSIMILSGINVKSQDAEFSQFFANPLYLNPALAGSENHKRAVLNYRNQWPSIQRGFITYTASYDQYINKMHGGVGVLFNADVAGDGILTTIQTSVMYAYTLQPSHNLFINMALQGTFYQRSLKWDMLRFGDQIDLLHDITLPTGERQPENTSIMVPDFAAGVIFGWRSALHGGVAVHHLTEPDLAFYSGYENNLPFKFTAHLGGNINLEGGSMFFEPRFFLSPNILYQQQGMFHQVNAGIYITRLPLVIGCWYRHNFEKPDAIIAVVGIDYKNLKIGYSYDMTLWELNTGGAHEITLTWRFHFQEKLRTIHPLRAPGF